MIIAALTFLIFITKMNKTISFPINMLFYWQNILNYTVNYIEKHKKGELPSSKQKIIYPQLTVIALKV